MITNWCKNCNTAYTSISCGVCNEEQNRDKEVNEYMKQDKIDENNKVIIEKLLDFKVDYVDGNLIQITILDIEFHFNSIDYLHDNLTGNLKDMAECIKYSIDDYFYDYPEYELFNL